ncbi:hypothetical protein Ga0100231_003580 [Opitutaceae bacterium TAV4]|nr:hypothetical protein Ga0100231_003580 [Opitutaceae bacterium TAV4]RRK02011.1 hypothetical protein Ga0100230_002000 [Opitutaceae bacterium TAV3]
MHTDTFADAALVRYRLSSPQQQIPFAILDSYDGQQKVLKLNLRNSSEKPALLSLAFVSTDSRIPFSPIIPPYVGLNAETFTIKLLVNSVADAEGIAFKVTREDGAQGIFRVNPADITSRKWNSLSWPFTRAGQLNARVTNIEFTRDAPPQSDCRVFLAAPLLQGKKITRPYDLLTTDAPLLTTGMDAPLATKPARGLPTRNTLTIGGYKIDDPAMKRRLPELLDLLRNEFPQWDLVLAPVWTPSPAVFAELPKLPDGVFFQVQKTRMAPDYLRAVDALPRNAKGELPPRFGNPFLATHPLVREGMKAQIDYAASLGVNSFEQADYTWEYIGGRWGYDRASVEAYREDLRERDEGLQILPGLQGKLSAGGLIHFWDYYEYYHGFRLNPRDLGLENWNDFTPVSEQAAARGGDIEKRNLAVFVMLYHYEWLRQAQRFGRWAKAHGGRHLYTLNPEDLGGGSDYVFLVRLADAGTPYIEYFGGPSILKGAYHNLPSYVKSADTAGRKFGLILEIGQTGHGQHYLSPETNYLLAFELAAAGLANYHNEWVEGGTWPALPPPPGATGQPARSATYHRDRWNSWMSGALGFTFAREQNFRRPQTRVFNISVRSPGYYVSSWIWGLNQGSSFGPLLADAHVPYQQWDRSAMPEILDEADVIFYNPPVGGRVQDWKALREWLKTPGRTLVLHSNIPFIFDNGQARLAPNVENVSYTGIDQRYTDFLIEKTDYQSVLFSELKTIRARNGGHWSAIPGAEILLGDKNQPLLSRLSLTGGGDILYLHRNPHELKDKERRKIVDTLVNRLKLPRSVVSSSAPVMAHHFSGPDLEVLNVWTGLALPGFKVGYGPHLMPLRGPKEFEADKRPYPTLLPETDLTVETPVAEAGEYRVFEFISGKEFSAKPSSAKTLTLRVNGISAGQFFFAKDSPRIREIITRLREQRARLYPYCPDLTK